MLLERVPDELIIRDNFLYKKILFQRYINKIEFNKEIIPYNPIDQRNPHHFPEVGLPAATPARPPDSHSLKDRLVWTSANPRVRYRTL